MRKFVVTCVCLLVVAAGLWTIRTGFFREDPVAALDDGSDTAPRAASGNHADPSRQPLSDAAIRPERESTPSIRKSAEDIESQRKGREAIGKSFTGRPGETYTVQNLAVEFASLSQKARSGDLIASRTLFEGIVKCDGAPHTLKRMQRMQAITAADDARAAAEGRSSGSDPVASQTSIEELFRRCGGLDEDHVLARAEFGRQLADSGDEFARLQHQEWALQSVEGPDYAGQISEVRTQSARYLDEELARGNSRALSWYASLHTSPRLGAVDPYQGYLYSYAYAQTPGLPAGHVTYFALAAAEAQLTPEQVARAQREGVALFNRCCRRP
jgi:hypothetical protein